MSPVARYGTWPSPLGPQDAAAHRLSRSQLASDGDWLWWLEGRPQEGGRVVLVRAAVGDEPAVVSPEGVSIRSRVHEYGGGAWCLAAPAGAGVAYVEERTQRVHLSRLDGTEAVLLTPEPPPGERWAHGGLAAGPADAVLAVRERHRGGAVDRALLLLRPDAEPQVLWAGRDFVGAPAVSPGGTRVAWAAWDHPNMPWDETELWVARLRADGALEDVGQLAPDLLAGFANDQPVWLDEERLVFLTDRRDWWQPWLWPGGEEPPAPLVDLEADFQGPGWNLGQHTVVTLEGDALGCLWRVDGRDHLGVLGADGRLTELPQPCVVASSLCAHDGGLGWIGQGTLDPGGVWWSPVAMPSPVPVAQSAAPLGAEDVSVAEPLSVPGRHGRMVRALYYPPRRAGWEGPPGERPPLIVHCHGGPTAANSSGFDPVVQLFTTRGYAVVAVDYAGSSGYGRAYRRALEGRWGVADVEDCTDVARWLAERTVDRSRLAIRGASAGGLTALGALVGSDVFAAAVSWYGVSDLMGLVETTHDFESRYTDRLVGPLPEAALSYRERSPLHRVAEMHGAVLLLQGEEDPVVPPEQTRSIAAALAARGMRCEVVYFAGESHGFRRAESLVAAYQAELAFYAEVLAEGPKRGS